MDSGLLWFDNDKKTSFEEKLARAVEYYETKYGHKANFCYVNAATGQETVVGELTVKNRSTVLPNHFWIGVSN